jgi:hypothetical protein
MTPCAANNVLSRRQLLGITMYGRGGKPSLLRRITRRTADSAPDLVSLAVLAIDRLGPAAVRACASGVAVCVQAPDEATAAVFRAALDETAQRRFTDRLIRIVVD